MIASIRNKINRFDQKISILLQSFQQENTRKTPLDIIAFKIISNLFAPISIIFILTVLTIVVLISKNHIKEMIFLTLAVSPVIFGSIIKKLTHRLRPYHRSALIKVWIPEKSYGFPSNHTAVATTLIGFIIFLLQAHESNTLIYLLASLIILVAISRIYLGVHYFTDIAGGILLGEIILQLLIKAYNYDFALLHSVKILWLIQIIGWIYIIIHYRKNPDELPEFLIKPSTLAKRIYIGVTIFILAFLPVYFGGWSFQIFICLIGLRGLYEIIKIKGGNIFVKLILCLFIVVLIYSAIELSAINKRLVLLAVLVATFSDTFGYLVGKKFGKIRITPTISPNKTLEGLLGSIILTTILIGSFLLKKYGWNMISIIILLTLTSFIGDLIFSFFKRIFKIKDYSDLLPGHGGILDRGDSHLFSIFVLYLITRFQMIKFFF